MTFPKHDRFTMYNKNKPPHIPEIYPMMLQNDDGTTTIVKNEEEHRQVSGKRFDPSTLVGAKRGEASKQPDAPPRVDVPDNATMRNGAKMRSLNGNTLSDVAPIVEPKPDENHAA